MKDVKLVIFDMDGLLFDTERTSFKAMSKSMEAAGFDFPIETYKRMIGISDQGSEEIIREICGKKSLIDQIFKGYDQEFKNILETEGIIMKTGVEKLLDNLDENSVRKCIASSSSRETIKKYLTMTGLMERFDFYVSGQEVENGKPAPDVFLEACRRANVPPELALILEDSLHGLRAAVKADIPCIIVPDLIEANDEMQKDAYQVVSNLEEVIDVMNGLTGSK
ncbi:hydrolase [Lentibacillus populi]|uniref:Hydrolase n=1 Tax=Lentibacillus populi TaxID=1827502 RepID=A0A9W5TYQ0_9BACI|nr:HAD family phosphatase [Lentibacillus populi]GGB47194.1 hydrolase [Lentibacillus populi]